MSTAYENRKSSCANITQALKQLVNSSAKSDDFAQQIVDLIQHESALYFVGLFLLDPPKEWAIFKAGNCDAGQEMRIRGHKIPVGKGPVGRSISMKAVCIVDFYIPDRLFISILPPKMQLEPIAHLETIEATIPASLLPDTWSQMIIPIRTEQGIIGALDLQSSEKVNFHHQDIALFLPLADQIALVCEGC